MTDDDRIRGLEETIAAQAQRLAEITKLRDLAHDAKVHLIGEHAKERAKRQALELEVGAAGPLVSELLNVVLIWDNGGIVNAAHLHAVIERATAWLDARAGAA